MNAGGPPAVPGAPMGTGGGSADGGGAPDCDMGGRLIIRRRQGRRNRRIVPCGASRKPNYDEFLIAYRHRDAVLDPSRARNFGVFTSAEYPRQIVLHGRIAGSWRREVSAKEARLTLRTYAAATKAEAKALAAEASRLGAFFGVPAVVRD